MTDETDDVKLTPGPDKRPRITLDLQATEVPGEKTERKTLPSPDDFSKADAAPDETEASESETQYRAEPPKVKSGQPGAALLVTHLLAGLAGGVIALVAAFYGLDKFRDRITVLNGVTAEDLRAEIGQASGRIALLEKSGAAPVSADLGPIEEKSAQTQQAVTALQAQLAALESRLASGATPSAGVDNGAIRSAIEPFEARILALESQLAAVASTQNNQKSSVAATALAVTFNNLRRAIATGRPYVAEFDAVARLGAPDADLTALQPHRETGIKTPEALEKAFTPLAKAAIKAEQGKGDDSFASRLWTEAKSVVRIRPTGEVSGDTLEAVLARAETRLRAKDVGAAAREAETLKGEAAVILQPWLADAKARADADAALDAIEAKLLASLKTEGASQ